MKKVKDTNCNVSVPCGRCPQCIKRRISQWSFRLMQEEKHSTNAQFLTLTYDTKYIPISDNAYFTLRKEDCQKFLKLLRYYIKEAKHDVELKYYIVGEYGTETHRPHYHIILFNCPSNEYIEKAWNKGIIYYGTVTGGSVGYTLEYISKPATVPEHINDDRLPEFSLMSKRLGEKYLTPEMIAWHKADLLNRMYVNVGDKKASMPRYFKERIYQQHEKNMIAEVAVKKQDDKIKKALAKNANYFRDQAELHKQEFKHMAAKAAKRKL